MTLIHKLFALFDRLLIISLSGAHVRKRPGLLVHTITNGCSLVHYVLWILDSQTNTTLLLLFGERYIDTVDCLFVGGTAGRGVLIRVLCGTVINAAEVIARAVVNVIDISHVDLRFLKSILIRFALGARRFPLCVPLISKYFA